MVHVMLDEAQSLLTKLYEAALDGEEVFIIKEGTRAIKLVPVDMPPRRPSFGSAKGLIVMSDDFDEPLDDFKDYME